MKKIGQKDNFIVYFDVILQMYFVYKDTKLLITKFRYADIEAYLK